MTQTLPKWWNFLTKKNILINGPQIAFYLKKDEKNIMLFGENHTTVNTNCGEDQKLFVDLFNSLIKRQNCKQTDIILEMTDENYKYLTNKKIDSQSKLVVLANNYINNYPVLDTCKINLYFGNPSRLNTIVVNIIKCINKILDKTCIKSEIEQCKNYIYKNISFVIDDIDYFYSKIHITHTFIQKCGEKEKLNLDEQYLIKIYKNIKNIQENIKEIEYYLENDTKLNELFDFMNEIYNVSLDIINIFTIIQILNSNNEILVYEGTLHILSIVTYLLEYENYVLIGISNTVNDESKINNGLLLHCMYLTYNLSDGIESIKNSENEKFVEFFVDKIKNIIDSYSVDTGKKFAKKPRRKRKSKKK